MNTFVDVASTALVDKVFHITHGNNIYLNDFHTIFPKLGKIRIQNEIVKGSHGEMSIVYIKLMELVNEKNHENLWI